MLDKVRKSRGRLIRRVRDAAGFAPPKLPYPTVDLISWMPPFDDTTNFGDSLSRVITILMLARRAMTLEDEAVRPARMLAIGSVMHMARDGDTIWGSGINGKVKDNLHRFNTLDVRAVRGPLTRNYLRKRGIVTPEVYGDPGLLITQLAGERFARDVNPKKIGFLPNINDLQECLRWKLPPDVELISPAQSWHKCVQAINECALIVGSSLHGIIVAEAFGIPARYVRVSSEEKLLKYEDYYEGTGRSQVGYATNIHAALDMGGVQLPVVDLSPLMQSFPYDLWING